MIKKLIILVLTAIVSLPVFSQITAGTVKLSLGVGNVPYIGQLSAYYQGSSAYTPPTYVTNYSSTSNSLTNMVGLQAKYFVSEALAVKFMGGGYTSITPGKLDAPGVISPGGYDPQTDVPTYNEVMEVRNNTYMTIFGADFYTTRKNTSLYGGVEGAFRYSNASTESVLEYSAGASVLEAWSYHGAITLGGEYNSDGGFFVGVEVRPFLCSYTGTTIQPIPGSSKQSENLTFGFFTYPMLHIGVNF